MTDPNQFGATPENNQQNPQPEQPTQPIPSPTTEFPNSYTASADTPTTPIHAQPDATQTPAYTPAPEYGAYATPASPAQQPAPTPEYGQYAQQTPQQATPQYGQYAGTTNAATGQQPAHPYDGGQAGAPYVQHQDAPYAGQTPTGNPYAQPQGAPYANPYQGQYANPYGQAPQYGAPLPQGVPGYMPGDASIGMVPLDQPDYRCTFGNAVKRFFKKYTVFSGRASRREFWWVILFFVLCNIAIGFVGGMFMLVSAAIPTVLSVLWTLATIVPYLAVAVRRLHDSNKSGWWVLLPGIPYVISEIINYTVLVPATDQLTNTMMDVASGLDEDVATQMFVNQLGAMAGPSVFGSLCGLIFLVSGLVLMCAAPKPEGARFDAPRSDSANPQAQGPSYTTGTQSGSNPYAAGGNPFAPQNQ